MAPRKPAFDPYVVLELERGCSEKDIQKAYKKQCLKWHPDKHQKDQEQAKAKFILAKEAFELLFDKEKRSDFDADRHRYEAREKAHNERMAKADTERKRHMENLRKREKNFEEGPRQPATTSSWDRGRHEAQVRAEIEEMRKRIEREANEEYEKQQQRLRQRINEMKEAEAREANGDVKIIEPGDEDGPPPQLKVRWKEEDAFASSYDDAHIKTLFEKFGRIHVQSPITPGKKGRRMCIIEYETPTASTSNEEFDRLCVAEKEKGDVPSVNLEVTWLNEPVRRMPKPPPSTSQAKSTKDVTEMSFEELQAQLFGDMAPAASAAPPRRVSTSEKWYEEEAKEVIDLTDD